MDWTHLWPGDFMENNTMWAAQIRTSGVVREPFPTAASAPIAMDDIAAVAATTLLGSGHSGRAYSLTGPEPLTRVELVRQIGVALGRDLAFATVSVAEAVAVLAETMGKNASWYVDNVLASSAEDPVVATRVVEEITGRPATTFATWAADNLSAFAGPAAG